MFCCSLYASMHNKTQKLSNRTKHHQKNAGYTIRLKSNSNGTVMELELCRNAHEAGRYRQRAK